MVEDYHHIGSLFGEITHGYQLIKLLLLWCLDGEGNRTLIMMGLQR